ncbi:hypothetical protein EVAR_43902_1 [Eumeta japonica]|uniref:Uncharacterized protein n=1 Tax=Eumeta variegata TaxID=151549 RepID=A0A4C1WN57_EUMVA|nr:hypothetical protein EVAR_43902_1 [Eumeta japonica]
MLGQTASASAVGRGATLTLIRANSRLIAAVQKGSLADRTSAVLRWREGMRSLHRALGMSARLGQFRHAASVSLLGLLAKIKV